MWRQSFWIPIAAILIWPFVIWIAQRFQQAKIEAQRDVQLALLAKFSSGEEMIRFLATDEGRRLMDQLASPGKDDPREHAAGMLVSGSILTMLAIGFAVLVAVTGERRFLFPAVIVGSVGIGLLIGSAIAHRFSTKKGLIQERF